MPFLGTLCLDIDECAATPGICGTNAACRNTPGSFSCSCLSSFMGNPPNVPCREPCQGVTCSDHAFCRCISSNKSNRHFDFLQRKMPHFSPYLNLNLKYQRFTPSGCKDVGIRKIVLVEKTQFLYVRFTTIT